MDQQEYERERSYHIRLLTEALTPQLIKIAEIRVKKAVRCGQINDAGNLVYDYAADACRRFAQLFLQLPLKMENAMAARDDRRTYLEVAASDGSTIPQETIAFLSTIPVTYEYLPAHNGTPRSILDTSILETLDRYIAQQLRDVQVYWDNDNEEMIDDDFPAPTGNMMMSVPWDLTREEVIMTIENMRNARK